MSEKGEPPLKVVQPPSALKLKRKAGIEYISNLMAVIDVDNSNIKEAIKYRSPEVEWNEKTLKKIASMYHKKNFAAYKADVESITNNYEAIYGSEVGTEDMPVGETFTSSPELRANRKDAIQYISSMMAEVDEKNEQLKDAIKLKAPMLDWEDKTLKKMATMRNKDTFFSYRSENEAITDEYELIFGTVKYE